MSFIYDKVQAILNGAKQIILANIDKTFPPDGVDLIEETLNGSKEEFISESGIAYRTHTLTRISSLLGLRNRKLRKYAGQSLKNLSENFFGDGPEAIKSKYPLLRSTLVTTLNLLLTPLQFIFNLPKIITELIPGILADAFAPDFDQISIKSIISWAFATPPWALCKGIYFTGCCLTSAYDTLRSSWKIGMSYNKLTAYLLSGACIFTIIIMYGYAFPIAAKIAASKLAPIMAHHLPSVIVNAVDKVAQVITPALTAIGKVFTYVIDSVVLIINLPAVFGLQFLATIPALVGAGLFVATAKATLGLLIDSYIHRFKKWWHNETDNDSSQNEGAQINVLNQQMDLLCALGVNNTNPAENETQIELYDAARNPMELAELLPDAQSQQLATIESQKPSTSSAIIMPVSDTYSEPVGKNPTC